METIAFLLCLHNTYFSITNNVGDSQFSGNVDIFLLLVCSHQNDLTSVLVIDSKSRQSGQKIEIH